MCAVRLEFKTCLFCLLQTLDSNSACLSPITLSFSQSPSPQPAFILQPTSLVTPPPKTREPPRYEEAVKQSRNLHVNNISQVRCGRFLQRFSASVAFMLRKKPTNF